MNSADIVLSVRNLEVEYQARRGQINLSLPMTDRDTDRIADAVTHFAISQKALFDGNFIRSRELQ